MLEYFKENWIAIVALLLSVITLLKDSIKDYKKNKKQVNESKKAMITISYINKQLIISNKGKSIAREIEVFVDGEEIKKNSVPFGAYAKNIDFSMLSPGNSIGIKILMTLEMKRNYKILVKWKDESSEENIIEDVINI